VSREPPAAVRPATAADAPALAELDRRVNPSPWSPGQFADACATGPDQSERVLVAVPGGQMQGFVVYSLVLDEACIHNIAVDPAARRSGLGGTLLAAALGEARSSGARRCLLEVRASNEAAQHLYRKHGFSQDGLRRHYYPTASGREDALLMSRPLGEEDTG